MRGISKVILKIIMNIDPHWISGFVDGEGTFYVGINPHKTMKSGFQVLPEFRIVQHKKDIKLLYALKKYFKSGVVRVNHGDRYELRIRSINALKNIVIPFFEKNRLLTQKRYDFEKFRKVIFIIDKQEHLTKDGIEKIFKIIRSMNRAEKNITRKHLDKNTVRSSLKNEA